jgi:hypothetical protein
VNPSEPPVVLTADCAGQRDRTLTVRRAYVHAGALSVPTVMIPLAVAARRWGPPMASLPLRQAKSALLLAAICLVGSWLHEALHLLGWKLAASRGSGCEDRHARLAEASHPQALPPAACLSSRLRPPPSTPPEHKHP